MPNIDPKKLKAVRKYNHDGTFYSMDFDANTRRVYAGSDDYGVYVFDLGSKDSKPIARWNRHDNYVWGITLVKKPKTTVVSAGFDRRLIWWDPQTGEPVRIIEQAHQGWIRDVISTSDGSRLITVGDDMLVKVWDVASGKLVHSLDGHEKQTPQGFVTALYSVAVSPDGKYIASGDRIGAVRIWDILSGKLLQKFDVPVLYTYDPRQRKRSIGGIRALVFSPDGNYLAVGGVGQIGNVDGLGGPATIEYWDWRKPAKLFASGAQGQSGMINHLAFHPDGTWLVGGGTSFICLWKMDKLPGESDKKKKDPVPAYKVKANGTIHDFAISDKGDELYAAGYRMLEVWRLV
ncbi:MAG: hypothetical protein KatS3mg105_1851 [Gemmatales bacterium]|nr:MAG: hypothetical protein KatS3mg105_1851 [Gemmatales bacterium]